MKILSSQPTWWPLARAQGLVQGDTPCASVDDEPSAWLVAIALLGALLCMLPVAGFLVSLLGYSTFFKGTIGVVLGLIGLLGAAALLRQVQHVFVTCMALVLWGLGVGLLVVRLADYAGTSSLSIALLCAAVAAVHGLGAAVVQARWVQQIMGVVFAPAAYAALAVLEIDHAWLWLLQLSGCTLASLWLAWIWHEPQRLQAAQTPAASARWATCADAAALGLLLAVLAAADFYARRWYIPVHPDSGWQDIYLWLWVAPLWASAVALLATGLLYKRWHHAGLLIGQSPWLLCWAGALLAAGAWFSPALAVLALIGAAALIGARWRLAALCALAGLWQLGAFYYSLQWSLAHKGLGLALLGALLLLGMLAARLIQWHMAAQGQGVDAPVQPTSVQTQLLAPSRVQRVWLLVGAVLIFGLLNRDVVRKENLIAHGQRILVPLVPVDPRSLMQGDYMALNFDLPASVRTALENVNALDASARVAASLNAQGHAQVLRLLGPGQTAASGEIVLPLKRLKGRWALVTDAYFFAEGQGERFAAGRFGDLRVLPDGRALLVGLADAAGQAIPVTGILQPAQP